MSPGNVPPLPHGEEADAQAFVRRLLAFDKHPDGSVTGMPEEEFWKFD